MKQVGSVVGADGGSMQRGSEDLLSNPVTYYVILDKSFKLPLSHLFLLKMGIMSHSTRLS